MHDIAIMSGQISPGLDKEPDHLFMPPQTRVENRPPTVLIIGIDSRGVGRDQRPHGIDVPATARFMDRYCGQSALLSA
jgi:hypothetical protein